MAIVTLTTDWNAKDYYVGAIKGKILSHCPDTNFVDISHDVQPYNISQGAFVIRNCYHNFPGGSIHIIGINSEPPEDVNYLAIKYHEHIFLGADNGIFGLIFNEEPAFVTVLPKPKVVSSFMSSQVFTDITVRLLKEENLSKIGKAVSDYNKRIPMRAVIEDNIISGSVIYIDSFKNAITNITRDLFNRIGKNRSFEIFIQSNHYRINRINSYYHETSPGELLAIFNSVDLLEIAICNGNAAELMNLSVSSGIRIKFGSKKQ